jgi:hypothetical protein
MDGRVDRCKSSIRPDYDPKGFSKRSSVHRMLSPTFAHRLPACALGGRALRQAASSKSTPPRGDGDAPFRSARCASSRGSGAPPQACTGAHGWATTPIMTCNPAHVLERPKSLADQHVPERPERLAQGALRPKGFTGSVHNPASAWLNFLHPNPITTTGWHRHRVMITGGVRQQARHSSGCRG